MLKYYYSRNTYEINIETMLGVENVTGAGQYKYDSSVKINYTIKNGYSFTGITGDKTTDSFTNAILYKF